MFRIQNKIIDTKNKIDREIMGDYYEKKFLNYLIKNNENNDVIIRTSNNYKFELYDFIKTNKDGEITYLELRSRIGDFNLFIYELFDIVKFNRLKELSIKNTVILYFCHINKDNYKDFSIHYINIDTINKIELEIKCFNGKNYFKIPTKYLNLFYKS